MSNFLAIATVTATLSQIVRTAAQAAFSGADVRNARPDSITGADLDQPIVNVFLFQASPNAALRNRDLPTRSSDGSLVQRPKAALDLHYLLSFYGSDAQLVPQRIMGNVLAALYTEPILSRARVRQIVSSIDFLGTSDLAEEVELVRFTNLGLSLEDIFKLWSAFHQSSYAPSTVFQASVVLLDGAGTPRTPLPVRDRTLSVVAFRYPQIRAVEPQLLTFAANVRIRLKGENLTAPSMTVRFGETEQAPDPPSVPGEFTVALPSGIRAGVNTVQVVHQLMIGIPPALHKGAESNIAVFVLRPRLVSASFAAPLDGEGNPVPTVTVDIEPAIGADQEVTLLLGERVPAGQAPRSFSFSSPGRATAVSSVAFIVRGVPAATYLVRVRVNGGESELVVQDDDTQPDFNEYIGPTVTVP